MRDPLERAVEAIADSAELDWASLTSEAPIDRRPLLESLRDIAAISRAHASRPRPLPRATPFQWGALQAREYVACGAHGDVYRAWDPRLEREVALKLLRPDEGPDDHGSEAIAEGRRLARVRHPNVVTVHGADRIDGEAGIWMEFVSGRTLLEDVQGRGPVSSRTAAGIGIAVCGALAAIHAAGLVHRDVKAQNIVRSDDGRITLMDFGGGAEEVGSDRRLAGTPLYLAPELLRGRPATPQSDLYAVGVLLFYIVSGRYPVTTGSIAELQRRHDAQEREWMRAVPGVPAAFAAVVDRALASDAGSRYADADAMKAALEAAVTPARPRARMRVTMPIAGTAAALVLAALGAIYRSDAASSHPTAHTIRPPTFLLGMPSPDGRFFPYADAHGDVQIWEVATGRSHRVTFEASPDESAHGTLLSPSRDRVAFAWSLPNHSYELRVRRSDGRWPQVLIPAETAFEPVPTDWSRDGRQLLCWLRQRNGTADLVLVPAAGGPMQLVHTFPSNIASPASLSPDGRSILTSRPAAKGDGFETWLLRSDGSDAHVIGPPTRSNSFPRWTADGRHMIWFLFHDTPPGSFDAWIAGVVGGAADAGTLLAANLGQLMRVSVADDGTLLALRSKQTSDIYTASLDLSGERALGAPVRISATVIGNHVAPSWSADGQWIAYFTTRPTVPGASSLKTLTVQLTDTGAARTVQPHLSFLGGYTPQWIDASSVVVWGSDRGTTERLGYYRIDLRTGATAPVLVFDGSPSSDFTPGHFVVSPDGKALLYDLPGRGIVSRDLENGNERVLTPSPPDGTTRGRFAMSPDGRALAYVLTSGPSSARAATLLIQELGANSYELLQGAPGESLEVQQFLTGRVIFLRAGPNGAGGLWAAPTDGRAPLDLRAPYRPSPNAVNVTRDGRAIAYSENVREPELALTPTIRR